MRVGASRPVVFLAAAAAVASSGHASALGRSLPFPSREHGAYVARAVAAQPVRTKPDGGVLVTRLSPATDWSDEPLVLLVLASAVRDGREWLEVRLPERPNGAAGWILRDRVVLSHTPYWIDVWLNRRVVAVYRSGRLVRSFRAVVGKASTPTPTGLFSIYERNRQPSASDFLGQWSLPLTAFSDTLVSFGGGPGRVAIHGRGGTSLLDPLTSARSHGCIRIDNGPISWIARHVPAGAPVAIAD